MKKWRQTIPIDRYFLLFILLFAYVQTVYLRISNDHEINAYTFTPEAAIATLFQAVILFIIIGFYINKWQKSDVFNAKEMLKIFSSSLISYLLAMKIIGFVVAFFFDTIERNFNQKTFLFSLMSDFLDGFTYGGFFLVYYQFNKNKNYQIQLVNYHKALSENRIYQLKSQLNPHFLFNNLNVLDQLIEEDKNKASDFLNEFADVYRYVLQATEKELVDINQEVSFAWQYFKLIQYKYGSAYQLSIETKNENGLIIPLTLQLLIENAVQHNLGTEECPVQIQVTIHEDIVFSNNRILKRNSKPTSGRALKNLKEQYLLLSEKQIEIQITEKEFSLVVPIIHKQHK